MKHRHLITGAIAALGMFTTIGTASASSHREAPAISSDPAADNTDLWAWTSPGAHDKFYAVASYYPFEEPAGAPNWFKFSDDVLYEIHMARGDTSLADAVTYQIRFKSAPIARVDTTDFTKGPGGGKEFFSQISGYFSQTYTVTKIVAGQAPVVVVTDQAVAPPNIGPRTNAAWKAFGIYPNIGANYDLAFMQSFIKDTGAEGRFFAGQTDDGFYVDLGRVFDLANIAGTLTPPLPVQGDNVAGFNVHTISLEIPTTKLTANGAAPGTTPGDATTLGVWASASRRKVRVLRSNGGEQGFGPWVQVSRLGFPLVNEAVIGIQDKDKYNRTKPATDIANFGAYILNPIAVRDAQVVGILDQATADANKSNRLDIVDVLNIKNIPTAGAHAIPLSATGDVLRVDMAADPGFPNGRPLPYAAATNKDLADVVDIELSLILLKAFSGVSDGAQSNDTNYPATFPYLPVPWEGARNGHYKPAP